MYKYSIVILNYLNYYDTIECMDSIFKMGYKYEGIVIVDNNSSNESFKVLNSKYKFNKNVIVVKTRKNYGFAKGNNIGISLARRKFHTDFVMVINNDVLFKEKDYFSKLLNHYTYGIGMIGSEIHIKKDEVQEEILYDILLKGTFKFLFNMYLEKNGKDIWSFLVPPVKEKKMVKVLHGSAILFTPDFFKYYKGFYDRTFLYSEEPILYLMCKKYGLRQMYVTDTYIYHKEDRSSELSFQNNLDAVNNYLRQSYKFLVWWIIKDKFNGIIKQLIGISNNDIIYESMMG